MTKTDAAPRTAREMLAYHEAGHAVIARSLKYPIDHVTIKSNPSDPFDGRLCLKTPGWDTTRADKPALRFIRKVYDEIVLSLAGPMAERILVPRDDGTFHPGADDDIKAALELAELISSNKHEQIQIQIQIQAHRAYDLLVKNWTIVERVASALLEQETLSGAELRALIKKVRAERNRSGQGSRRATSRHTGRKRT